MKELIGYSSSDGYIFAIEEISQELVDWLIKMDWFHVITGDEGVPELKSKDTNITLDYYGHSNESILIFLSRSNQAMLFKTRWVNQTTEDRR